MKFKKREYIFRLKKIIIYLVGLMKIKYKEYLMEYREYEVFEEC